MVKDYKLKPNKLYLFFRFYCIAVIIGVVIVVSAWFRDINIFSKNAMIIVVIINAFYISAMCMLENLSAFPLNFSIFGRYERTPLPEEKPLYRWASSNCRIGRWFNGTVSILIYNSGLGISMFGVGKAFIPFENITELKKGFLWKGVLIHSYQEIRSPICLPFKIIRTLQGIMKNQGRHFIT
ncbi:MAG: hypothetical protein PHE49_11405 [bacterium]|nr:hypothetical protein [bacterium]